MTAQADSLTDAGLHELQQAQLAAGAGQSCVPSSPRTGAGKAGDTTG
jgi:hypothetical protein